MVEREGISRAFGWSFKKRTIAVYHFLCSSDSLGLRPQFRCTDKRLGGKKTVYIKAQTNDVRRTDGNSFQDTLASPCVYVM